MDALGWLYGGDRDVDIQCLRVKRVRIRYSQVCCSVYHKRKIKKLPAGTEVVRETAKVDGVFGTAYTCLGCIAKAHKDLE